MKDKYPYHIHSDTGTIDSFHASSDEEAEDIFHSNKNLPPNIRLDLNRFNINTNDWTHITSSIRIPADK